MTNQEHLIIFIKKIQYYTVYYIFHYVYHHVHHTTEQMFEIIVFMKYK